MRSARHRRLLASRRITALVLLVALAAAGGALLELSSQRGALRAGLGSGGAAALLGAVGLSAALCLLALGLLASRRSDGGSDDPVRWRPAVGVRAAFAVAVSAAVLHVAWLQPYQALVARGTLGVAGGVLAVLALTGPARARKLRSRAVRVADLLVFAACFLLLAGELALTGLARVSRSPLLALRHASPEAYLAAFRLRPEQASPGFPVNAAGHFDEEWAVIDRDEPLAVTIGDSFSTSIVPHADHFTTVAENQLGRGAVANVGVAAAGLVEYLHLLRTEGLALDPDVVVVNLFVGNDLDPAELTTRTGGRLERWLSREHLLLPTVVGRLRSLASEHAAPGGDPRAARAAPPAHGSRPGADGADRVPTATNAAGGGASAAAARDLLPWLSDPAREPPSFGEERFAEIERQRARVVCRPEAPPDWDRVHALLLELREACGATPFAVMLIPDEFQVEDAVWELVRQAEGGAGLVRDLPQRALVPWLAAQGIPCLDLLPVLRAAAPLPDGRRHLYHLRDTHFNARGNALAGEALADFLRRWWE